MASARCCRGPMHLCLRSLLQLNHPLCKAVQLLMTAASSSKAARSFFRSTPPASHLLISVRGPLAPSTFSAPRHLHLKSEILCHPQHSQYALMHAMSFNTIFVKRVLYFACVPVCVFCNALFIFKAVARHSSSTQLLSFGNSWNIAPMYREIDFEFSGAPLLLQRVMDSSASFLTDGAFMQSLGTS